MVSGCDEVSFILISSSLALQSYLRAYKTSSNYLTVVTLLHPTFHYLLAHVLALHLAFSLALYLALHLALHLALLFAPVFSVILSIVLALAFALLVLYKDVKDEDYAKNAMKGTPQSCNTSGEPDGTRHHLQLFEWLRV